MDPRLKDGVRAHPGVLVAGFVFHAGIAAATFSVAAALLRVSFPAAPRIVLVALTLGGAVAGLALFVRRMREPVLQAISVSDDYISNLLVVTVLVAAAAFLVAPKLRSLLLALSVALAIYAPFGKIRHCILFFITRARFGAFIGRRGVLVGRSRR
jgi:hypothetical protein